MIRLPDAYTRSHALGVTDTLGASLVLIGLALHQGFTLTAGRILVILLLLLFLNPVISHATIRAALRVGLKPWARES
jgi:multicomponent Na+:H+ antiporter subunit G